jgi:hypothetical protein
MSINSSLGVVAEATYGTAVTVTRFYPLLTESVRETVDKMESEARRAGTQVLQDSLSIPIFKGAAGPIEIPVMNKDFGFWLQHLLGAVATTGPTDSAYVHTGTVATLKGKSFSCQINRPFHDSGTDQPFSYEGGKIKSWEFSAGVNDEPKLSIEADFEDLQTGTSLASPSYTTGLEMLSWAHASSAFTIAGTSVPITKFSVKCDNGLKTDRHYIRGSGLKKEPVANAYRNIEWEVEADFDSLTQYNRFKVATNAGQYAQLICTLKAPTLIGVSSYPALAITIPAARFDTVDIENGGMEPSMQTLHGVARYDGTNSPLTLAYTTSQATP